jgi:hypothetical protein
MSEPERMQRLVFSLRVERNLAVGALWRIAGTPVGAVDLTISRPNSVTLHARA